jgi:hypothetical protein
MTRDKIGLLVATAIGVKTNSVLFGVLAGVAAGAILKDMGMPAEVPDALTPVTGELAGMFVNWAKNR